MEKMEVRIAQLEAMRVLSVMGFGKEPEGLAWEKMDAWVKSHPAEEVLNKPRFFGFNNPEPSPGSPNYGYEIWVQVGPDVQSEGEYVVKEFGGGLYAVTRCQGVENIYNTWQKFVAWIETSPYTSARHQWLEEFVVGGSVPPEDLVLDLWLPIKQ